MADDPPAQSNGARQHVRIWVDASAVATASDWTHATRWRLLNGHLRPHRRGKPLASLVACNDWDAIEVSGLATLVGNRTLRTWLMGDLRGAVVRVEGRFDVDTSTELGREMWRLIVVLASPPRPPDHPPDGEIPNKVAAPGAGRTKDAARGQTRDGGGDWPAQQI